MDLGLQGKRAIVTGGSRGIGFASAVELVREGARVVIVGQDAERLSAARSELGDAAHAVAADLSTQEGCELAVEQAAAWLGGVDILVNCAGAARSAHVLRVQTQVLDEAMHLKAYGYLRMAQLVVPHMREGGWGRIVNIAGGAGASPTATNLPLSIANAAVLNMTRALSDSVVAEGIRVNVVCPGLIGTDRARDLAQAEADRRGVPVEEVLAERGAQIPAGRIGRPEEVGRVVCVLASEVASYISGSSLYMDGGARRATP